MTTSSILLVLLLATAIAYLKWIIIGVLLPWQALYHLYKRHKRVLPLKALAVPFFAVECWLTCGGYERWMLFQVAELPSVHVRTWIYRLLGAEIGERVVMHFGTEIRCPERLRLGEIV